eukprot:Nitzschia sp. Nitz4//scaffold123_size70294//35639//36226//NITZ4_005928-RA/size70294-exonerate_est2genome-gene-0.77-mRNA-1//-1//CDS//3329534485//9209//frame0
MVRHKTRWLLVQLDFQSTVGGGSSKSGGSGEIPSKNDLGTSIRRNLTTHFGVSAEGAALETQVRFWDPDTRLLLLRVPREFYGIVRSSLTLWTHHNASWDAPSKCPTIVASVLAVSGCARTAKLATIARLRKIFRHQIQSLGKDSKRSRQELQKLETLTTTIQSID